MEQPLSKVDYIIAALGGLGLSVASTLVFLIWGKREIISEQFFGLWTNDQKLLERTNAKGFHALVCLRLMTQDQDIIQLEMQKFRKSKDTVESVSSTLDYQRRFISLTVFVLVSAVIGVLNYSFITKDASHRPFFELPSQYIFQLNEGGFGFAGLFLGIGNQICKGGFLTHTLFGIPRGSLTSLLIVAIIFLVNLATTRTRMAVLDFIHYKSNFFAFDLDDSIFLSFGTISVCLCVLAGLGFFYCLEVSKLHRIMMTKRGKRL